VGIDLGAVRPVTAVHVQMANSSRPNDYLHGAVLEYSRDATSWTTLGTFANQPDVRSSPATAVNARYLRLRSTGSQTNWLIVDEFTVTVRPGATALTNLPAYQTFVPANLVDGDTTTWFWSNGTPAVGGYAGVDLGAARTIGPIDVLMANGTSPNDYAHSGVLESSVDGATWRTLATFSGHNEITVAPPAGTTARYVRVRNTGTQTFWLLVDELLVS
jgi:hypothetical protein